jgi:hypothetical protein
MGKNKSEPTESTSAITTFLVELRRRFRARSVSLSVDVTESKEPPSIQFVKETSTFLSFLSVRDIVGFDVDFIVG